MMPQSSSGISSREDHLNPIEEREVDTTLHSHIWQDEFRLRPKQKIKSVPSDDAGSLYQRCWKRAEHCVQEFIKEQDAIAINKPRVDTNKRIRGRKSVRKEDESDKAMSSRRSPRTNILDRSDTEHSQLSPSSSKESKTYSEVYSEIYEESMARQKRAEKIRQVYNYKVDERTKRWVERQCQYDTDYCTTGSSDLSVIESEENDRDDESLIKEQLLVIAQYMNNPLGSYKKCIEKYVHENSQSLNNRDKVCEHHHQFDEKQTESCLGDRSTHISSVMGSKSLSQDSEPDRESSQYSPSKYLPVNEPNHNLRDTEILQFEHCEIYHVKRSEKKNCEYLEFSSKCTIDDNHVSSVINESLEQQSNEQGNHNGQTTDQIEEQSSQEAYRTTDTSYCSKTLSSRQNETDSCTSSLQMKRNKSQRLRHRHYKSESDSNNSHKSLHPPTPSRSSRNRSPNEYSSDSTSNFYLSSRSSGVSSKRSRKAITSKTFEDRGCSPIVIKSIRRPHQLINTTKGSVGDYNDSDEAECSNSTSSKSELEPLLSQSSIVSEDKSIQYPSEVELEDPKNYRKRISNLNPAGGNAMPPDNVNELLDLSLSEHKKDGNSQNSSNTSMSSADRSSIWSISSYEPSVRFHRRTKPDDDDDDPFEDDDASEPLTYKKYVSRLAERALRACTDYYNQGIKSNAALDHELNKKVEMLYNSEMRFSTLERQETGLQDQDQQCFASSLQLQ